MRSSGQVVVRSPPHLTGKIEIDVYVAGVLKYRLEREPSDSALRTLERLKKKMKLKPDDTCGIVNKSGHFLLRTSKTPTKKPQNATPELSGHASPVDVAGASGLTAVQGGPIKPEMDISDMTIDTAFSKGNAVRAGSMQFCMHLPIMFNPPTVSSLHCHGFPMVGCPLLPVVRTEFSLPEDCDFQWYRLTEDQAKRVTAASDVAHLNVVSTSTAYSPTREDIGHVLACVCTPKNSAGEEGLPEIFIIGTEWRSKHKLHRRITSEHRRVVRDLPLHPVTLARHKAAQEHQPTTSSLRVVSYNILFEMFADSDWALDNLYPYYDKTLMTDQFRNQLVLKELTGYNADVICLQETGRAVFQDFLQPHMARRGMDGFYSNKESHTHWGMSCFWRRSRLELLEAHRINLTTEWQRLPAVVEMCKRDPGLETKLRTSTTVAQVLLLAHKDAPEDAPIVCLANMHLFSNPLAPHIRVIQTATILDVIRELTTDRKAGILMTGDFNCERDTGAYQLLDEGHLGSSHVAWAEGDAFTDVELDTDKERETQWNASMRPPDLAHVRAIFNRLDGGKTGLVDAAMVAKVMERHNFLLNDDEGQGDSHGGDTCEQGGDGTSDSHTFLIHSNDSHFIPSTGSMSYANFYRAMMLCKQASIENFYRMIDDLSSITKIRDQAGTLLNDAVCYSFEPHGQFGRTDLSSPFQLRSAFSHLEATYCAGSNMKASPVDHMFYTDDMLELSPWEYPFLSRDDMLKTGLPTAGMPSDHIALVADFSLKPCTEADANDSN